MRGELFVQIVVIIFSELRSAGPECDKETDILLDEGNMGHTSDFNWLGLLKVSLNDGDDIEVAVTGLVLVKENHALVSADDVVRIPNRILLENTQAMFISEGENAVNYSVISYVTHREYQTDTFNSLAIVLLDIGDNNPLVPVCLSEVIFDTDYLYLTGFTDENDILEKMIYRNQYMERPECDEFYEKEGLIDKNRQPVSYFCTKGWSTNKTCLLENGMALISNSSGWFTLVGFSIHGPGCSAPARFLSTLHYVAWIHGVTRVHDSEELYDQDYINPNFRRTDESETEANKTIGGTNATKIGGTNATGWTWPKDAILKYEYVKWPFSSFTTDHFTVKPSEDEEGVIHIYPFDEMFEYFDDACSPNTPKVLLYQEEFNLTGRPSSFGATVTYKISLYDLRLFGCSCVKLETFCGPREGECDDRSKAVLAFKEVFDYSSGMSQRISDDMVQVIPYRGYKKYKKGEPPSLNPNLKPVAVEYEGPSKLNFPNYDLYIQFKFKGNGHLRFQMFAINETKHKDGLYESNDYMEGTNILWNRTKPEPQPRRVFKKKLKLPRRRNQHSWWGSTTVDGSVSTALVVDDRAVLETVSEARRVDATLGVLMMGCLLFCA